MSARVILVDDHTMFRDGIRAVLSGHKDLSVVGEAADAHTAYTVVEQQKPDVVLLDVQLPGCSGVTAARELHRRDTRLKLLMMSAYAHEDSIAESIAAGALGYIGKEQACTELVEALRTVARGQSYLPSNISERVVRDFLHRRRAKPAEQTSLAVLSAREREVFELLVQGFSNSNVGAQLSISTRTVETHRAHLMKKLNVTSLADLMRFAARNDLLK